jgi:hypothetical protein
MVIVMIVPNKELESFLLVKEIADQKRKLETILAKYHVHDINDIEQKVKDGTIPEHPAYEDYLAALAIQEAIDETKSIAKQVIEDF